jgi:hypothetical protein
MGSYRFYSCAHWVYHESKSVIHIFRDALILHFLHRWVDYSDMPVTQSLLSWDVQITKIKNPEDLKIFLTSKNILFNEGGHTIYIIPQPGLGLIFPEMVRFYPEDSIYKMLLWGLYHCWECFFGFGLGVKFRA